MRVIDFRAGPTHAKRLFVLSLAQREGVSKVYTLVERDEVQTWMKLGFAKEGNIPGFYKRSDAFLLGCSAAPGRAPARPRHPERDPGRRARCAWPSPEPTPRPMTAAQERMERDVLTAERGLKDGAERCPPPRLCLPRRPTSEKPSRRRSGAAER